MAILPVLPVADIAAAIDHYVADLGFEEEFRVPGEDGGFASGQVRFGDNHIMFNRNPADAAKGGGGIWLWLRVDGMDIDAIHEQISAAPSVEIVEPIGDRFWGDRSFALCDGLGYVLAFNAKLDQA